MDSNICRERIISEDFRDFVITDTLPPTLSNIPMEQLCEQTGDFDYHCIYVSAIQADPVNLGRYPYRAIPKCYSLLSMEALNQAGILAIQNYPTLQLKGKNVMIIPIRFSETWTVQPELQGSGTRQYRPARRRIASPTELNIHRK